MIHFFDPWPDLDEDCGVSIGKNILIFCVPQKDRGVFCSVAHNREPVGSKKITPQEFIDRFKLIIKEEKNKLSHSHDVNL